MNDVESLAEQWRDRAAGLEKATAESDDLTDRTKIYNEAVCAIFRSAANEIEAELGDNS